MAVQAADIQQKLEDLVRQKVAPGFQLGLGFRDRELGAFMAGSRDPRSGRSVLPETWFDLASLTKVISTVTLLMVSLQNRKLQSLEAPLNQFFPSLSSDLKTKTLNDLLHHRAGLAPVFETTDPLPTRDERLRFFLSEVDRTYASLPPQYSDVGFMLLGMVLEILHGRRLREIFDDQFAGQSLGYGPFASHFDFLRGLLRVRQFASCGALEDPAEILRGESQDPRAQWMMGDAGHSGLFGSVEGIESWAQMLFRAYHGKDTLIGDSVIRQFIDWNSAETRFLGGFDRPTPPSQAGAEFPTTTIGHLGFTGASFWMDLESGARVTLLCHRFSEGCDPEKLKAVRPAFHNWLWEEVFRKL